MREEAREEGMIRRIQELKKEKDAFIMAHNYQAAELQDVADFVGDSLEMARFASKISARMVIVCGVYFMAETVKLLNPDKKVLIPDRTAGCPLAETISPQELLRRRAEIGDVKVVSYVNTYADVKALSDVVCTSANAPRIVSMISRKESARRVLFVPDRNLAHFTREVLKDSDIEIIPWNGFCPVHEKVVSVEDVRSARKKHPGAVVVVHPEVPPEVQKEADYIRSTGGMIRLVEELKDVKEFVVGTEVGMIYRLSKRFPDRKFYPLNETMICTNMKKITLKKLLNSLEEEIFEVVVDESLARKAIIPVKKMLEYSE